VPTYRAIFTTLGLQRLAEAQATYTPLVFEELAVGDGNGSTPTPNAAMTELVNETARVSVNLVEVDPDNPNQVRVEGLIPAGTGGFTIREAGIFNGDNELIAVANYPDIYKPVPADGVSVEEYIRILLVYENPSDAIELTTDTSVVMATRFYVDEEILFRDLDERNVIFREDFLRSSIDTDLWSLASTGGSSDPTLVHDNAADGSGAAHPLTTGGSGTSTIQGPGIGVQVGTGDFGFSSRVRIADGGDAENLAGFIANNFVSVIGPNVVRFVTGATNWKAVIGGTAYDTGVAWGSTYQWLACRRRDGVIYFYIDGVQVHSEAHTVDMGAVGIQAKCSAGPANDGSMYNDTLCLWAKRS
jgi:hypothetical protein